MTTQTIHSKYASAAPRALAEEFEVLRFDPCIKGCLRGFADVRLPDGTVLEKVTVHKNGRTRWAMPAATMLFDRNGEPLRDASGKIRYVSGGFATKADKTTFFEGVIAALQRAFPGALA